ncbi:HMG box domain-containing protein [Fusarium keratoplasticum]|uniref:HMG box domain-containing protein n=1 Tax=Fusarium keratoplasticum TaxID=1328300 RepID=A0ACC0RDE7_9HYPO|nr:HMG box domain-containing protein [Fusarium keratoplasticum]KAI8683986.1 HMG box domain-containing protein [Fusarium keratoplasticum]KAI8688099.1 HMG box domain-containing protein [Fusarium keratoplasticum]
MFTAVGRATARRIQAPSAHPAAAAQLLLRQAPATSALPIRAFSASAPAHLPAASDKKSKATAKKPAAKKKPAATTKKAAPVAKKTNGRPKKEVDPEENKKAEIRQLKKWALRDTPAALPHTKWAQFVADNKDVLKGSSGLGPHMAGLSSKFHSLSAAEISNLENIAAANREKNAANLKAWIRTHEPARIHIANQARRRLTKLTDKNYRVFEDDRLPKRPLSSYTNFTVENWPRLGGSDAIDGSKNISEAWKALSPSEKAVYEEKTAQASAKYEAEMEVIQARADAIKAEADPKSKK